MQYSMTLLALALLGCFALAQGIALKNTVDLEQQASSDVGIVDPSNGLTVQSGYEGYLISSQEQPSSAGLAGLLASKIGLLKSIIVPVSGFLITYGVKVASVAIHAVIVLAIGFAVTSALCSFTSLCTIAGNGLNLVRGKLVKDQVKELARTYMTPENMEYASKLVQSAFDKYHKINQFGQARLVEN